MGGSHPSDRRALYTHSDYEKSWNWGQAKYDYNIILKDNGDYISSPWDILQYYGCISFSSTPDRSPLLNAPCYIADVVCLASDVRVAVANKVNQVKASLGLMEGPVAVFIYRDYNHLGNGKAWMDGKDLKNFGHFRNEFNKLNVTATIIFPSIMSDGKVAPNYAILGQQHKWLSDILEMPHSAYFNKWMMQCYTYCEDSAGKFFPCGCSWDGECESKVVAQEGVIDSVPKHTLFYGAYMLNLTHGWISSAFQGSQYLSLRQNILPMDMDMYNNCRFVMKSVNDEHYVYEIGQTRSHVLRKGPPGTRRICESTGGWGGSTSCRDAPISTKRYTDICTKHENKKHGFNNCTDDNAMCYQKTAKVAMEFQGERDEQQYNTYYSMPYRKASKKVRISLTYDSLAAYSEDSSQSGDLLWVWSFERIAKSVRIPPLALLLTDKGELVLFNGLNQQILSLTTDVGIDVNEEDGDGNDDMTDDERRRFEELMDYLRNRAAKVVRDAEDQRNHRLAVKASSGSDDNGVCEPPPFNFI